MDDNTRTLTVITTLGRKYTGKIDIPNPALRTTDLLNSATTYWKNQQSKIFDDAILLREAKLIFGAGSVYREFAAVQIRLSKVIFFYDNFKSIGSDNERRRTDLISERAGEPPARVYAVTNAVAASFFEITGRLSGLAKQKGKSRFIPLHEAAVTEIIHKGGQWVKKKIALPHGFVGVNAEYIEAFNVVREP